MAGKAFTPEEIRILSENPNTFEVSTYRLAFTAEAKEKMDEREKEVGKYRDSIDDLYSRKTDSETKVYDFEAQKRIEDMTRKISIDTVKDVKDKYGLLQDQTENGKRSDWNPAKAGVGLINQTRRLFNVGTVEVEDKNKNKK